MACRGQTTENDGYFGNFAFSLAIRSVKLPLSRTRIGYRGRWLPRAFLGIEAALTADNGHRVDDLLDDDLIRHDVQPSPIVGPADKQQPQERSSEVDIRPPGGVWTAGARIRRGSQRCDPDHAQHAHQAPGKGFSLQGRASLHQLRIELVGLGHLFAPAAGTDEIRHPDRVDEHDRQRRRGPSQHVDALHASGGFDGRNLVDVSQRKPDHDRDQEQPQRDDGQRGENSRHRLGMWSSEGGCGMN